MSLISPLIPPALLARNMLHTLAAVNSSSSICDSPLRRDSQKAIPCAASLQVSFGALPTAERLEVLRLVAASMPMAPDVDLAAVAESMRCAGLPGIQITALAEGMRRTRHPVHCGTADSFDVKDTEVVYEGGPVLGGSDLSRTGANLSAT